MIQSAHSVRDRDLPISSTVLPLLGPEYEEYQMNSYEFAVAWVRFSMRSDRGASLVEYALLLTFVCVLCLAAMGFLGAQLCESFDSSGQDISNPN
jgi:pilus assembly protein Flp/PilA